MTPIVNKKKQIKELQKQGILLRKDIVTMVKNAGEGHIASALSCIDILCALYFKALKINPKKPDWEDRDRFILSKGHGCSALYATLARKGFFPLKTLKTFGKKGSILGGHPDRQLVPGVEVSTGSLGHGLAIGAGISLAAKRDERGFRTFVLLGDGECQEGSVWETAMFASSHKLDNLIAVIDFNELQAIGKIRDVISLSNFSKRWESFGWNVEEIDGHNYDDLLKTFRSIPFKKGLPNAVIAHTVKGKGVSFMENAIKWHARAPSDEEYKQAIFEIEHSENPKRKK